ncbi:hypothetical protein K7X08_037881 [Anisodus acutangulus]|uniref:PPM-type phosphatase domain-containing protein n=1 Tax=Anisodus acutangulus TaxID=402998 RepID=A0A9Q1MXB4_9SOLA|nr:hypothetical protein K7X08_037881 [Anisodus acutangulus]
MVQNFGGQKGMFFCGVFDGHGPSGHKVAHYVRDSLPSKISSSNVINTNNIRWDVEKDDQSDNPIFAAWKDKFLESFKEMDEELEGDGSIESYCSGTTAVTLVKQGEHLIVGNLGDSRAIICTRDDKNELVAEQLTIDLKPNLPAEYERIKSCEGRVMAMEEEPNIYRVWMPDQDCPGLAMARAFGDFCLKDFGLISVPEVYYRKLTEKDEFIVLATDGLWDVLSNDEVIRIVATARKRSIAARLVVHHAVRAWKYKYPRAKIDDCAVISTHKPPIFIFILICSVIDLEFDLIRSQQNNQLVKKEMTAYREEQTQIISGLKQELVDAKEEIKLLKHRCLMLESTNPSRTHDSENVVKSDHIVNDESIILAGGYDGDSWLSVLDSTRSLQLVVELILKAFQKLKSAELDGALYVVGGFDGSNCLAYALGGHDGSQNVSSIEIYDPRRGTWMIGEPMNYPTGYSTTAVLKESIYVIGGVQSDNELIDMIERYKEGEGWQTTDLRAVEEGFLLCYSFGGRFNA